MERSPEMPLNTEIAETDDLPKINLEKIPDVQSPGALSQFVRKIDLKEQKKSSFAGRHQVHN